MKKIFCLLVLAFLFSTCKKEELSLSNLKGKILYYSDNDDLYTYDIANGNKQRINIKAFGTARWSHKGDKIALASYNNQILIVDAHTFDTLAVKKAEGVVNILAWSADDSMIVYPEPSSSKIIWVSIASDSTKTMIVPIPKGYRMGGGECFDWSSTADVFLFQITSNSPEQKICTIRTDGSDYKEISTDINLGRPRISPNGKNIAYSGDSNHLYVMDINGNNKKFFWDKALNPCWSNDGSMIMATYILSQELFSTTTEIRAKEIGGKQREVTIVGAQADMGDWYSE